ncbi:MAG TPA: lipopolysaccharide transport periplasmic protein LptA [Burkholderiales bacterium]|jgi:lipopolysaccharide export system protein LptA
MLIVFLAAVLPAWAEKADRDKPTQIEANRMSADDIKRMTIFEGNVILTKGTVAVRAERIIVRQDAEGYQLTSATGAPVRFKQKLDPKEGEKEGQWMDGEALRVEIDERKQTLELFDNARVNRGGDQVTGAYIFVDQRSDFYQVTTGKGGKEPGRVTMTMQPSKGGGATKDGKK